MLDTLPHIQNQNQLYMPDKERPNTLHLRDTALIPTQIDRYLSFLHLKMTLLSTSHEEMSFCGFQMQSPV